MKQNEIEITKQLNSESSDKKHEQGRRLFGNGRIILSYAWYSWIHYRQHGPCSFIAI